MKYLNKYDIFFSQLRDEKIYEEAPPLPKVKIRFRKPGESTLTWFKELLGTTYDDLYRVTGKNKKVIQGLGDDLLRLMNSRTGFVDGEFVSTTGAKWDGNRIKTLIDKVVAGNLDKERFLKTLPDKLADGSDFRNTVSKFIDDLERVRVETPKPSPKNKGKIPPAPKPAPDGIPQELWDEAADFIGRKKLAPTDAENLILADQYSLRFNKKYEEIYNALMANKSPKAILDEMGLAVDKLTTVKKVDEIYDQLRLIGYSEAEIQTTKYVIKSFGPNKFKSFWNSLVNNKDLYAQKTQEELIQFINKSIDELDEIGLKAYKKKYKKDPFEGLTPKQKADIEERRNTIIGLVVSIGGFTALIFGLHGCKHLEKTPEVSDDNLVYPDIVDVELTPGGGSSQQGGGAGTGGGTPAPKDDSNAAGEENLTKGKEESPVSAGTPKIEDKPENTLVKSIVDGGGKSPVPVKGGDNTGAGGNDSGKGAKEGTGAGKKEGSGSGTGGTGAGGTGKGKADGEGTGVIRKPKKKAGLQMEGWEFDSEPKIDFDFEGKGRIVFAITVGSDGDITSIDTKEFEGFDKTTVSKFKDAVKKSTFKSKSGLDSGTGTITFDIQ